MSGALRDYGVASEQNRRHRRTMEDEHVVKEALMPGHDGLAFLAVYDGHGGRDAARFAAAQLHENLATIIRAEPSLVLPEALRKSFLMTDEQMKQRELLYQGATAAAVLVQASSSGKRVHVANCGDTRVILGRGGKATRLSYDHRASDGGEAARVSESGGFIAAGRVNAMLSVSRALGDHAMKEYVIGDPYLCSVDLPPGERAVLIIACDGVWDVMSDQEALDIVQQQGTAQTAAEALLKAALAKFSTDNITVVVAFV